MRRLLGFCCCAFLWLAMGERAGLAADVKVACVGDSITYGAEASSSSKSYPAVLGTLLGAGWNVRNFGNSGKTMIKKPSDGASYWDQSEFTQSQSFLPDVVVLMLGTNDAKTTNWKNGNNTYTADYAAMVAVYAGLASTPKIYLMLPPPALSSSFNIQGDVIDNQIIPIIKKIAGDMGLGIIDLNTVFRANDAKSLMSADGIHPNDAGYRLIAQTVAAALRASPDGGVKDASGPTDGAPKDAADPRDAGPADSGSSTGGTGTGGTQASGGQGGGPSSTGGSAPGSGGSNVGGRIVTATGGATGGDTTSPTGGGAATPGTGGKVTVDAGPAPTPGSESTGCGCDLGATPRGSVTYAALLFALVLVRRRPRGRS